MGTFLRHCLEAHRARQKDRRDAVKLRIKYHDQKLPGVAGWHSREELRTTQFRTKEGRYPKTTSPQRLLC